jgi:hypothetical protein
MQADGTVVEVAVLGCKASIAVMLIAAGGAKLADLPGFADTARLFVPRGLRASQLPARLALGVACGEVIAGALSLALPATSWLNLAVLVICCGFLAVWTIGYARHRGRACSCFGALSRRGFTAAGIVRAACLVAAAAAATTGVPALAIRLSPANRLGLTACGALVAAAAFSAAAAVGARRGWSLWCEYRFI